MAYLGNTPTTQGFIPAIDYFSGNGSTVAFTLSRPVASVAQVQATIENVPQNPGTAFTVSGNTITFDGAPPSGTNNIYVYYTSPITQVIQPSQGTVGTAQMASGVTVSFADGSASAPSITNTDDTNTGVFFPAADTIAFAEGGAEIARFDSNGNLGIGTSSPSTRLDVNGVIRLRDGTLTGGGGAEISSLSGFGIALQSSQYRFMNGTNTTEYARINTNGQIAIGTTSFSSSRLMVAKDNSTAYDNANVEMIAGAGNVVIGFHCAGASAVSLRHVRGGTSIQARNISDNAFTNYEASAFTVSSDYRLKENIVLLENAIARVSQIPVHRFNFKSKEEVGDDYGSNTVDGFLAHEVQAVVPEAVFGEKDAVNTDGNPIYQTIDQSKLVPLLTAAIQEQQAIIAQLQADVAELKGAK